ncbi:hypothetical protein B0H13DRAFT_2325382 [Mycena leptocephala]|nr:hypothetical protein B0H13DRAFT_2325382 [Mycena leptocephala]
MPRISARARAACKAAFIRSRRTYLRSTAASLGLTPTQIAEDAHAWAAITAGTVAGGWGPWGTGVADESNPGGWGTGPGWGEAPAAAVGWGNTTGWGDTPGWNPLA